MKTKSRRFVSRQPQVNIEDMLRSLTEKIQREFHINSHRTYTVRQLQSALKVSLPQEKRMIRDIVRVLLEQEYITELEPGLYQLWHSQSENDTEMHAILSEFGLPYSYPKELEEEAKTIELGIEEKELLRRKDMRDVTTFTIDPYDAKDFDDALSFRRLDDSDKGEPRYEVGVHIADVTHYVLSGSAIDDEAYKRATSVYLVDRTVPMLPEHLSNYICSLRPDEDKLTFSVIFTLDSKANVEKYAIKRTIIRSNRRFTYEEAQERIESKEGDFADELNVLNELAKQLRKRRFEKGAINFDREEMKFRLDDKGQVESIYFKRAMEANNLIEEFMLLANRTVAQHIARPEGKTEKMPRAFVYRVHDVPDPDKLRSTGNFIRRFGYNLKQSDKKESTAKNINKILAQSKDKPEQAVIETLMLRSMAKAVYSTDNIGHYGLAFPYYTHFTSPIRRYPDMMVHRMLDRYLKGGSSLSKDDYEEKCKHCSDREQLAANAERASVKYKEVEFMTTQIGKTFEGMISGITQWGLFVQLKENHCEGFIPIRDLGYQNEYFFFNEDEYCLESANTDKKYTLGDEISVVVARTDLVRRQLDFLPTE